MSETEPPKLNPLGPVVEIAWIGVEEWDRGNLITAKKALDLAGAASQYIRSVEEIVGRVGPDLPLKEFTITVSLVRKKHSAIFASELDELSEQPFSIALRRFRLEANLSLAELERRAGFGEGALRKSANNPNWVPRPKNFRKIVEGLGYEEENPRVDVLHKIAEKKSTRRKKP